MIKAIVFFKTEKELVEYKKLYPRNQYLSCSNMNDKCRSQMFTIYLMMSNKLHSYVKTNKGFKVPFSTIYHYALSWNDYHYDGNVDDYNFGETKGVCYGEIM